MIFAISECNSARLHTHTHRHRHTHTQESSQESSQDQSENLFELASLGRIPVVVAVVVVVVAVVVELVLKVVEKQPLVSVFPSRFGSRPDFAEQERAERLAIEVVVKYSR